jgi:hypothetical protein
MVSLLADKRFEWGRRVLLDEQVQQKILGQLAFEA